MNRDTCVRSALTLALVCGLAISVAAQRSMTRKIFVGVVDTAGTAIPSLSAADFMVTEGGTARKVTAVAANPPMRIVLLVDTSSAINAMLVQVRAGLAALLEGLPAGSEVALVSTGGQLRIRAQPTAELANVASAAASIASEGGANAFLDSLLEADRRLLKSAPERWPVFVIVTTDSGEMRGEVDVDAFNAFSTDFLARGGTAHALIVQGASNGVVTDIARVLANNTGGVLEVLQIGNALPGKMKALSARLVRDHQSMTGRYEVQFASDAAGGSNIAVQVAREGARVVVSGVRPF